MINDLETTVPRRRARRRPRSYLLVACTELYTHYLLGDRVLDTFKAFVLAERARAGRSSCTTATRTTTPPSSAG